jgi:hypothetical protein
MSDKGVLRKRCDPSISGLHLNIFDFTPLLDHELLLTLSQLRSGTLSVGKTDKSRNGARKDAQTE